MGSLLKDLDACSRGVHFRVMSKRRLDFLDLPTPTKRAKLKPMFDEFATLNRPGFVRFTSGGTQYKEIPLMLPFSVSGVSQDGINPLPVHNWNNLFFEYTHEALHHASIQVVSETVQAITIEDRAIARFSGYIGYSRTVPPDYRSLPRSHQWIPPVPFNKDELKVSSQNSPLYIDYQCIQGAYYPRPYFGIRQTFIINPLAHPWYKIRRGTKVVLASVIGDGVAYFVTRIRFIHVLIVGVEVVAITDDGSFHDETSLSWPPFILEVPITIVDKPSFGDWVPSIND